MSSGLEPVYALHYDRGVRQPDGSITHVPVECYALAEYARLRGADEPLTEAFVTIDEVGPDAQLRMQAALQAHVDNAIAKTVNVSADIPFAEFAATYRRAYAVGPERVHRLPSERGHGRGAVGCADDRRALLRPAGRGLGPAFRTRLPARRDGGRIRPRSRRRCAG